MRSTDVIKSISPDWYKASEIKKKIKIEYK